MLEFTGDGAALYDFLETRGVYVMFDDGTVLTSVFVDPPEPFTHAFEELDVLPETVEVFLAELDPVASGFVEHEFHVGQYIGRVLAYCDVVAHPPELFGGLAYGLDESEFLHVSRGQCPVEIVDQCDDRLLFHL